MLGAGIIHKSKYLIESELQEQIKCCPFCESNMFKSLGYLQKAPDVLLLKCLNCNCSTSSRIPKDEVISQVYSQYYNNDSVEHSKHEVNFNSTDKFANHLLGNINLKKSPEIRILDFGGGDGTLAKSIAEQILKKDANNIIQKIVLDIVELSPIAVIKTDSDKIQIKKFSSLTELNNKEAYYNMVVASAVIEHLPYPGIDFYKLFDLVADEGFLYARTPFMAPFFRFFQLFNVKFDLIYPMHLHDLGDGFWNNTPKLVNNKLHKKFKVVKSQPSIVETELKYHFIRTVISFSLKLPWRLFKRYKFVGGWEIFLQKI